MRLNFSRTCHDFYSLLEELSMIEPRSSAGKHRPKNHLQHSRKEISLSLHASCHHLRSATHELHYSMWRKVPSTVARYMIYDPSVSASPVVWYSRLTPSVSLCSVVVPAARPYWSPPPPPYHHQQQQHQQHPRIFTSSTSSSSSSSPSSAS